MEGRAVWNGGESCMLPLGTVHVLDSLELKVSACAGLCHSASDSRLSQRLRGSLFTRGEQDGALPEENSTELQ